MKLTGGGGRYSGQMTDGTEALHIVVLLSMMGKLCAVAMEVMRVINE